MEVKVESMQEQILLKGLNQRQTEAVESITGSTLVIAGAGSGKTAVLTRRVAYLVSQGVVPGTILCLTFTNKAAREMQHRVRSILESVQIYLPSISPWIIDYTQVPLISTFHSLGMRLVREFGDFLGYNNSCSILDDDEQKKIIKSLMDARNLNEKTLSPKLVSYFISQCKQELLIAKESKKITREYLPVFHQLYADYEAVLKKNNSVDFDDLLFVPYQILSQNEEIRTIVQNRWLHVLVDEFQDTNLAQFELIQLIIPPESLA